MTGLLPLTLTLCLAIRRGFCCIQSALCTCGFHICRFNPLWIKNIWKKNSRKFGKQNQFASHQKLLPWKKGMKNLGSILKSRDLNLPTKVRIVKATVFPAVTYGCETWAIKKTECRRIDAFELWCWRRLLRVPWTARRSKQSLIS